MEAVLDVFMMELPPVVLEDEDEEDDPTDWQHCHSVDLLMAETAVTAETVADYNNPPSVNSTPLQNTVVRKRVNNPGYTRPVIPSY